MLGGAYLSSVNTSRKWLNIHKSPIFYFVMHINTPNQFLNWNFHAYSKPKVLIDFSQYDYFLIFIWFNMESMNSQVMNVTQPASLGKQEASVTPDQRNKMIA